MRDQTRLASHILECIQEDRISTWSQPIVSLEHRRVIGHELLTRVAHPSFPNAATFFEAVVECGLTEHVSKTLFSRLRWAMDRAATDTLFINCLPQDVVSLTQDRSAVYDDFRALAPRIVLELTEGARVRDLLAQRSRIDELKQMGFGIALDDLGSGYAGLSWLAEFEPHIIKIDISLVRRIHERPRHQAIVRTILTLCQSFGSLCVAEGIETGEELRCLLELGCPAGQGYFLGRPRPLEPTGGEQEYLLAE